MTIEQTAFPIPPSISEGMIRNGDVPRARHINALWMYLYSLCGAGQPAPACQVGTNGATTRGLSAGETLPFSVFLTPYTRDVEVSVRLGAATEVTPSDTAEITISGGGASFVAPVMRSGVIITDSERVSGVLLGVGDGTAESEGMLDLTITNTGTIGIVVWAVQAFELFNPVLVGPE